LDTHGTAIFSFYSTIPAPSLPAAPASNHICHFTMIRISNMTNFSGFDSPTFVNTIEISPARLLTVYALFEILVACRFSGFYLS
jgi:hypothetical protein